MNPRTILRLEANPNQIRALEGLQTLFAQACSCLALVVRDTRCWNRVALHHLAYRTLRQQFPQLGAQMVCNAIYSVSRSARVIYQAKNSPWNIERRAGKPLPLIRFSPSAPVYFDRHTLSLRKGGISMYTLDGRIRFDVSLSPDVEKQFREEKLKEVMLSRDAQGYFLAFGFGAALTEQANAYPPPNYLSVQDSAGLAT